MSRQALLFLGLLFAGITGCGGGPSTNDLAHLTVMEEDESVSFGPADTTYVDPSYRLGPGDELELNFLFDPGLNSKILVRPDGGINLPILGDLTVSGRTPGVLARQIAEAYSQYYTNPQMSINLTKYAPPQCYVLGDVRYPKAVNIRPGMTVVGAIAEAGGGIDGASMGKVILIRRVSSQRAVARRINVAGYSRGKGLTSDLYLQDFDIIFVPRTTIAKLMATINQVFSPLSVLPILYLRGWEAFNTDLVYTRPIRPSEITTETP